MGARLSRTLSQTFPPKPHYTEKDLPDLYGKVYIVTGSNTGVGKEVAQILYSKNAKVYIAARSEERATQAIEDISKSHPHSKGSLIFLKLDLNDLTSVKASAEEFLATESKLHVLFNNAAVMTSGQGDPKSAQGYERHFGVNCLGVQLFTKLLTPTLIETAKSEPPNTVRVVWVSSGSAVQMFAHKDVGLGLDNLDFHVDKSPFEKYALSKVGNYLQGVEYARRHKNDGIVSIPLNPGVLDSDLHRNSSAVIRWIFHLLTYPRVYGAYTELFAGLSPAITLENSGSWVVPWGRIFPIRADLVAAGKSEAEGGNAGAQMFYNWCDEQISKYI